MRLPGPPLPTAVGSGGPVCPVRRRQLAPVMTNSVAASTWRHTRFETGTIDRIFHALADPTRQGMVARLSHGPASGSALAEPLATSVRRSPSGGTLRRLGSEAEGETTVLFMLRL
jgi:hypothetical protein